MKVVIAKYGGFSLSKKALLLFKRYGGCNAEPDWSSGEVRASPALVAIVEVLGGERASANGARGPLKIVEVPDDAKWEIASEAGNEWVAEVHRVWE